MTSADPLKASDSFDPSTFPNCKLIFEVRTQCQATYIWIDESGENLRSKMRVLDSLPTSIDDYPICTIDGSLTGQSKNKKKSDIILKPVETYPDPFLGSGNRLVLCETFDRENNPTSTNHRNVCKKIMDAVKADRPMFEMEQEYFLLDADSRPYGWKKDSIPTPQKHYYCGIGADRAFGRSFVQAHTNACILAGLKISGANAGVTPAQWEFQVGICKGIEMADQLWIARYLLHRIAEKAGIIATFDSKPKISLGDWNGASCQINVSTAATRDSGGIDVIKSAMKKLKRHHFEHLKLFDPNGKKNDTLNADKFSWAVGDRDCWVRIPHHVETAGHGYFEDRRPPSNCDPYVVTKAIASALLLEQ
uniref:Glutamine synthetase n=1 Tax=Panagrolaimus sp. ES5 TaxID=591445 RepID=A0AC34GPZ1_9BILA